VPPFSSHPDLATTNTRPLAYLLAGCLALYGCGADDGSTLGPGSSGDDGKVHPPANGQHMSETAACDALQSAFRDKALTMGCTNTVRTCPGFLRVQYSPDCMEYDQGTVQGCIDYFQTIWSCEELIEDSCVLVTYPGTEPAGCP